MSEPAEFGLGNPIKITENSPFKFGGDRDRLATGPHELASLQLPQRDLLGVVGQRIRH